MNARYDEIDARMSDQASPYLDDSFDAELGAMILPWLPWVGREFHRSDTRTLVLGESPGEQGPRATAVRDRILHREGTRETEPTRELVYLRNFESAALGKKRPSAGERMRLWSRLAYHNLLLRTLPPGQARPSDYDYKVAWEAFVTLLETLPAERCIVFGLEGGKVEALQKLLSASGCAAAPVALPGRHSPLALSFPLAGRRIEMLFLRQPNASFSWKRWGEMLRGAGMLPSLSSRATS